MRCENIWLTYLQMRALFGAGLIRESTVCQKRRIFVSDTNCEWQLVTHNLAILNYFLPLYVYKNVF